MWIIRRKDPPAWEGAKTFWITVAKRETEQEAKNARDAFKKISKTGTLFWIGEEKENEQSTNAR